MAKLDTPQDFTKKSHVPEFSPTAGWAANYSFSKIEGSNREVYYSFFKSAAGGRESARCVTQLAIPWHLEPIGPKS
jgi:hypothetical protein